MFLFRLLVLSLVLTGCGSDDSGSAAEEMSGLWIGTTTETVGTTETELVTTVLFYKETVYVFREDETQIGTYLKLESGHIDMDTAVFSYATPDTDNNFYVGAKGSERILTEALLATDQSIFFNYEGVARSGSSLLALDTGQVSKLDFNRVKGQWSTTDSILYINDAGGFIGSASGCQWEGDLSSLSEGLLTLNIERQDCDEFNQSNDSPVEGLALIDGEGALNFIVQDGNEFLWMRFNEAAGAAVTPDEEAAEEDPPAE